MIWAQTEHPALEVQLPTGRFVGLPIHWSASEAVLLRRDGGFFQFDTSSVQSHQLLDWNFRPQTLQEARTSLRKELGKRFDVEVAGPYVVATPSGSARSWKQRFTALFAGFSRYASLRHWKLRKPDFPLIVVVMPSEADFRAYAARLGKQVPENVVGCYFPKTNRCVLYELGGAQGKNWAQTEETIAHEAVHQLAFNTGVHERLFKNPLWFVEGLAAMFEVPEVYDLRVSSSSLQARINQYQVKRFRKIANDRELVANCIESLVRNDTLFRQNPEQAYAVSWAMNFYLCERMAMQYGQLISLQQKRGREPYGESARLTDFFKAFRITPDQLAMETIRLLKN